MFIWMTALFTFLLFPFAFIFGTIDKITTAGALVTPKLRKKFPWSSKTPVVIVKPHAWFLRLMDRQGVNAYAFSGFMCFRNRPRSTEVHECIHVMHQSVVSPILYAVVYLLDWLVFLPFKSWWPAGEFRRAPVAEKVAYHVSTEETKLLMK